MRTIALAAIMVASGSVASGVEVAKWEGNGLTGVQITVDSEVERLILSRQIDAPDGFQPTRYNPWPLLRKWYGTRATYIDQLGMWRVERNGSTKFVHPPVDIEVEVTKKGDEPAELTKKEFEELAKDLMNLPRHNQ